jgi:hypothetical protein
LHPTLAIIKLVIPLFAASYLWFFDLLSSRLGYSKKVPTIVEASDAVEGHPHEKQEELRCSSTGSIGETNTTLSSLAFRFTVCSANTTA